MALRYRTLSLALRLTSVRVLLGLCLLMASVCGQTTLTEEDMIQTHVVHFEDKENFVGEYVPTIRAIIEERHCDRSSRLSP